MKKVIYSFLFFALLIFIITNPSCSLKATQYALSLWYTQVLPTLFPFILISNILISFDALHYLTFFIKPIFKHLLHLSANGCFALIIGLFCGYPMGAKIVSDLYFNKKIEKNEACYLLTFINNASPAFIISFVINNFFPRKMSIAFIIYTTTFIIAYITHFFLFRKNAITTQPTDRNSFEKTLSSESSTVSAKDNTSILPSSTSRIIDMAISNTFETVLKLAGYIILFTLFSSIVSQFHFLPSIIRELVILYLEITSGITHINAIPLDYNYKFALTVSATAFGGLSCLMQSISFIKEANLPLKYLIIGKIISGLLCFIISLLLISK